MKNNEDTQQFSAAEIAQLKRYAKRTQPVQAKQPSSTNRVHLAIVIAIAITLMALMGLAAWYLYLSIPQTGTPVISNPSVVRVI